MLVHQDIIGVNNALGKRDLQYCTAYIVFERAIKFAGWAARIMASLKP
jgi:hypothetical protein